MNSNSLIFALGGLGIISVLAAFDAAWANIKRETGLRFTQFLRLSTFGYIEKEDGTIYFNCPEGHGLQHDIKHGYTDIYGGHTLIFGDGTYCDCPRCVEASR